MNDRAAHAARMLAHSEAQLEKTREFDQGVRVCFDFLQRIHIETNRRIQPSARPMRVRRRAE